MKIRTWTVVAALTALAGSPARAQIGTSGWAYDNNVKGVTFASDCCEGAGDCCEGVGACGDGVGCGDGCGGGGLLSGMPGTGCAEAFSLAGLIGLSDASAYQVGGWSQWGYHNNNDGVFNTNPHTLQAQQQWLYLGRTVDGSNGLDIGGRVDLLYGTDASNTQAFGNPAGSFDFLNGWDHGQYGWALPQAYLEMAYGDLSVKVGHFFTLLGYQVVPATGNFFYSIPYTFNFSEAFTHTGVLSTYKASDALTLYNGWTLGWDTGFDQLNQGNSYLGGFAYTVSDDVVFNYITTYGNFGWRDGGDDNSFSQSAVITVNLTDNLQYVGQSDVLRTDNPGVSQADTVGLNQYLFYTINDVLKTGARIEWWKADGISLYEMAYGVNIKALNNLLFRPEIRYNWCPSDTLPANFIPVASTTGNATQFSDYKDNTIFGMDMIYTF